MLSNASVSFLLFALAVILIAAVRRDTVWRGSVLLAASAVFLWLCSAGALWPLLLFIALGFAGLKLIESGQRRALAPLAIITVLAYIWLKQYTFIPPQIFLKNPYTTLGLSYILFRILHLVADANSGMLPGRVGLLPYLAYTLNFTTLVAGPIQRYQDFWATWREPKRLSLVDGSSAVERIIVGFFKVNVMSLIFSLIQTRAIAHLTESTDVRSKLVYGAITIAAYPFFLYCNFSCYIDVVIGIARLMRRDLRE